MCDKGNLDRIRPGVYAMPVGTESTGRAMRHVVAIQASVAKQQVPAIVSHISAAALHGLPLQDIPLDRVHMTRHGAGGGHTSTRRHLHMAPLSADDITEIGGVPVTSVARTVIDIARTTDFTRGVAMVDAALNNAMTTRKELMHVLRGLADKFGSRRATAAVEFADHRSESVGESASRIIMAREGLPTAELQRVIRDGGVLLGRVDFYLAEYGVVGEFDGKLKYVGDDEQEDNDDDAACPPGEVAWAEKQREDALRNRGLEVVRWTWPDLHVHGRISDLFASAIRRSSSRPEPCIDMRRPQDDYVPRRKLRPRL